MADGIPLAIVPCSEQRILRGQRVNGLRQVSPRDGGIRARNGFGLRRRDILPKALDVSVQKPAILMRPKTWEQRFQCRFDVANGSERYRMSSADMGRVEIDLDDLRLARIELRPGEVSAEQK
jgi:hypothetical protein